MVDLKLFDLEKGQTSIKHIINTKEDQTVDFSEMACQW